MHEQKIKAFGAKKRKQRYIYIIVFGCFAVLIMFILALPIFNISQIEITGNSIVSTNEIMQKLDISENQNIHTFFPSAASKNIMENPYIMSAKITKEYPDKIVVDIVERIPRAYVKVKNMDTYLLIDEMGMVLEVTGYAAEKLPVIVGLKFSDFARGHVLEAENKKSFECVVMLSALFKNNNVSDDLKVEISDEKDIHLYIAGVDVIFGTIDDANEKMLTVIEAMKKLPKDARGFLDVKTDLKKATFSYLK